METAGEVLHFWFEEHGPDDWFAAKPEFDSQVAARFAATHAAARCGEAWRWRETPEGRLAEILVLDQFSRQLFRDRAEAFAADPMALVLAQEMVADGLDQAISLGRRHFVYMPYMHSESAVIHAEASRLFTELGDETYLGYQREHAELIRRFGRYPGRNAALGRPSTPEELRHLQQGRGGAV